MSVSSIGSPAASPFYTAPVANGATTAIDSDGDNDGSGTSRPKVSQSRSDIASLLNAVQSGDMSTAQQALTAVKNDVASTTAGYSPASTSSTPQLPPGLQNLFDAVQSGDATIAQSALTKLETDAQQRAQSAGANGVHGGRHHHHHHAEASDSSSSSSSSSSSTSSSTSSTSSTTTATDPTTAAGLA